MENGETNLTGADETAALLAAATAGCPPALSQRLMLEVTDTLGLSGDPKHAADDAAKAAAALQMMAAAAPRDALEAMLAAQMAAAHGAAMRAMRRAAECTEYPQIEALYARQAARLMHLFMRQTEALERRRASAAKQEARHAEDRVSPPSRSSGKAPSPIPLPKSRLRGSHTAGYADLLGAGERAVSFEAVEPSPLAGEGWVRGRQHRHNGTGQPPPCF